MALDGTTFLDVTTLDEGPRRLDPAAVAELRAQLRGSLLLPGAAGFDEATRLWNGMVRKRPALVVQPADAADVAAVVRFAAARRVLISVKGGGHNIAGTALADGGITLDMSRMRDVEVDPARRVARVGPGCLLQDVDRATQAHGLATVLGFVSDTGVAGLTLGGGFGYLARRFGWTVDNLLEVEIVTADGEVRRASRAEHPDLFWALRGGGGNFGVVTRFVYRLHEVGPEITGGILALPAETPEEADRVLRAYREATEGAPRELALFCELLRAPPAPFLPEEWHGRRVALLLVCHSGAPERAEADLAPLRAALGEPIADLVARRPYVEQQGLIDATEPPGMHYYWKTEWASALSPGLLRVVRDLALSNPVPGAQIGFLHVGGALNERPWDDGAVGNRDARYAVGITAMWEPDEPQAEAFQRWVREAWNAFRPFCTGGNYVNFQGADEGDDRLRASYGKNYAQLAKVKARYDPENLFRVNRNILPQQPAFTP